MALYLPAKELQIARNDLNHIFSALVSCTLLKTIGACVESSGIDMCWIEPELYGPATVKQILDGKHVK